MPALPIGDCIKFGWETFKKRPWILIGALLLVGLVYAIPGILTPHPEVVEGQPPPPPTTLGIVMGLVSFVVSILASLGLTSFSLRAHDNIETVTIGDLWNPDPVWRYLGAYLLILLIVIVGFILLVIPGIIASLGLSFATYLVIDRGMQPVASIKESWRITKGNKWRIFLLGLALTGVNILGALALVIGLLVSVPITLLAVVHAYRYLLAQAGPAPVPA
jgi:uncharacterized membrane protein